MTCQELDARLDDWLDGTLDPAAAREVEAHLAGCAFCRENERRLRLVLSHAAALPRSLTPPNDLWPAVERRIARPQRWAWLTGWTSPLALAAAATVLIGVAAVLWQTQRPAPVERVAIPSAGPTAVPVSATTAAEDPGLVQAERQYEAAANALLQALQERESRAAISPEDLARIRANLDVIDRALSELRAALAKDPANPELNRMLVSTHRKKVDVLRRVVFLSTPL